MVVEIILCSVVFHVLVYLQGDGGRGKNVAAHQCPFKLILIFENIYISLLSMHNLHCLLLPTQFSNILSATKIFLNKIVSNLVQTVPRPPVHFNITTTHTHTPPPWLTFSCLNIVTMRRLHLRQPYISNHDELAPPHT